MGLHGQEPTPMPVESGPPKFHKRDHCVVCKKTTLFAPRPDRWMCIKCGDTFK